MQNIIARCSHSAQRQQHAAVRAKLQNQVRTDIRRPNVVLGIHSHRVGSNKKIIGDAAKVFPVSVKLHQRMFAAMKHVDVALRIYRHTSDLNEMLARWQLKEVRNRFVVELWNLFLGAARENQSRAEQGSQDL